MYLANWNPLTCPRSFKAKEIFKLSKVFELKLVVKKPFEIFNMVGIVDHNDNVINIRQ